MKKIFSLIILTVVLSFSGCMDENYTNSNMPDDLGNNAVQYAKYFELYPNWDNGYCVVVDSVGNKFVLLKEDAKNPNIPYAKVINIPIKRTVTDFYCPIISTADILNAHHETILGAPKYTIKSSQTLQDMYDEGKVVDIGSPSKGVNYEIIANLTPEIVFLGDWGSEDKVEEKLKELGMVVSRFHTYKEPTYLGKVEWIKFAAAFWGEDAYNEADTWFKNVVSTKEDILNKVKNAETEPTVVDFSWSKSKKTPRIYGNDHYYNMMIDEFKGEYVFSDYNGSSSQYIDKEMFYERAMNADIIILRWFYKDEIQTKEDLLEINPDFAKFKAFKNGRFYVSKSDYYIWESRDPAGYMMDYAKMIHPELFGGDDDLKYYIKVQ